MSARYVKVGVFLLLLAATAFVVDVLSPATPTPNANLNVKFLLLFCGILVVLCALNLLLSKTVVRRRSTSNIAAGRHRRALIAMICVLLC